MKGGGHFSPRYGAPGPHKRMKARAPLRHHERMRRGVARPVMTENNLLHSRGHMRGNAQSSGKPKPHMMARNNSRQAHHGTRTGGQGTLQNATRLGVAKERSFDSRIVGGLPAAEGEYRFMAALYFEDPYYGYLSFGCGGSLIAPDIILTAAHCGQGIVASVRVGSTDLNSGGDMRSVISQCVHPSYETLGPFTNDFMLLKLDSPIDNSLYPTVELNEDTAMPQVDDTLTVIGFGRTSFDSDVSQSLLKVEAPVTSYELCDEEYGGDIVEDIQFCAGFPEGGKSACMGDSGGPILEMRGSTPVQVGVVSYGPGICAQPGTNAVYARVTGAYEWIQDTMAKLGDGDTSGCSGGIISDDDDSAGGTFGTDDDDSDGTMIDTDMMTARVQ
jgi:secreted trypsin-like serine protease